jgi:predicted transposase/invertase (TIGR01784 family)
VEQTISPESKMGKDKQQKNGTDNQVIKATSDVFIAMLLSAPKNEPLLCGLINAVLTNSGHVPIKSAEVLNPFNVKEFAVDKQIVLDVRVKDELERIFNIEIQTTPHIAFIERVMFGWADTFSAQLHAGNEYRKLKPVFCIVITEFKILAKADTDAVHLIFELRERNHPEVVLSNHLQIHFLRLYELLQGRLDLLDGVSPELRHWLNFWVFGGLKGEKEMSQIVENDPLVMEAVAELQRFSSDPEMRELERRRKLWKLEYYSGLEAAKDEGKAEGEAIGEARGIEKGIEKGIETLLRILTKRLGDVPHDLHEKLQTIHDLDVLGELTDVALDCQTLDEFEESLNR